MTRFMSATLLGTLLLAGGCGGDAPPDTGELAMAPAWVVEQDLPGCDAYGGETLAGAGWTMLQHPGDRFLVVMARHAQPRCIDTADGIARLVEREPNSRLPNLAVGICRTTCTTGPVDDDPIPIGKPARDEEGTTSTGTSSGASGGTVQIAPHSPSESAAPAHDEPVNPLAHLTRSFQ